METTVANKLSLSQRLSYFIRRGRGSGLETDLNRYCRIVDTIRSYDYRRSGDRDRDYTQSVSYAAVLLCRGPDGGAPASPTPAET